MSGPLLFITLTFNTTQTNYSTWTTNWNPSDPCWSQLDQKQSWLKNWAQNFDPPAEPSKTVIQPLQTSVSQHPAASYYLNLFLRRVRRLWKPNRWKWVVVSELQKNGIWHFHLLSTPIVPYSHKCTLDKTFTSCWNCRAYISELWPYGRVQSKSPGLQSISNYLAKYLAKSFHLREIYQQHGLKGKRRTYRFYLNLYEYEERAALIQGKSKLDQLTGQLLNSQQMVFRHYNYQNGQASYFYRTNEKLVGKSLKPVLIKKNFRLGTRSLQPLNLLKLVAPPEQKEALKFQKPPSTYTTDFQEFLITRLLFFCETAAFVQVPLEQEQVPKECSEAESAGKASESKQCSEAECYSAKQQATCNQNIHSHFQPKPLLHFTFTPASVPLVLQFLDQLDNLVEKFAVEESQEFYTWPPHHNQAHQTLRSLGGLCSCEITARNTYLNYWTHSADTYFIQGRTVR